MDREWTITELDEMFADELEYLYSSDNPLSDEDEFVVVIKDGFPVTFFLFSYVFIVFGLMFILIFISDFF